MLKGTHDSSQPAEGWRFGDATLDLASLELRVRDEAVPLERKPLEVLKLLLSHAGEVVTKEELLAEVWSGRVVTDATLTKAVAKLRAALGDDEQAIIRTVHGYGYRLMAPVTVFTAAGADAPSALELTTGMTVPQRPHWRLEHALGRGGFAEVWLAEHSKTHDRRVFKFAGSELQLAALRREVTLYRLLRDALGERRDIVHILDWNFEEPPFFIETEYVAAGSLLDWAATGEQLTAMPLRARLELLAAVADVVADAHSVGVLHKDLKPANILLDVDADGHARPRLADFGSGRLLQPDALADYGITRMGFTRTDDPDADPSSGTPMYLAPEVANGDAPTVQSDLYALGVMLYQLVVGDLKRPLAAGWEADVPDPLLREDIAATANGDPDRRLIDARLLAERLRGLEDRQRQLREEQEAVSREQANRAALARMRARRPWMFGAAAALIAGLAVSTSLWLEARQARALAEREAAVAAAVNDFLTRDLLLQASPEVSGDPDVPASELVRRAAMQIDTRFAESPQVAAAMRLALGSVALALGRHEEAGEHLEAAAALADAEGDPRQVAAEARINLAGLRYEQGRADLARRIIEPVLQRPDLDAELQLRARLVDLRALAIDTPLDAVLPAAALEADVIAELGPEHPLALSVGSRRAEWLRNAGELHAALAHFEDVFGRHVEAYGKDDLRSSEVRRGLAGTLYLLGENDSALAHIDAVYGTLADALPGDHTRVLGARADRASILGAAGQREQSLSEWQELLAIREASFGPMHPDTRTVLNNLADAYAWLDRHEEALELFRESHRREAEVMGEDHPYALLAAHNEAAVLRSLERFAEAEALQRGTVERAVLALPADHWQLAIMQSMHGELLKAIGHTEEARAVLEAGVPVLRETLGDSHPQTERYAGVLAALSAAPRAP